MNEQNERLWVRILTTCPFVTDIYVLKVLQFQSYEAGIGNGPEEFPVEYYRDSTLSGDLGE